MSLIYITGPTGAGKTTVRRALQEHGYTAFDTDEDGIAEHQDSISRQRIVYPADPAMRTPEWQARHAFNLSVDKVEQLSSQSQDRLIFLCGAASNDLELAEYFSQVICLDVDESVTESRVLSRTTNSYGKSPEELREIKARHNSIREKYSTFGARMVDATQPINRVIDSILEIAS